MFLSVLPKEARADLSEYGFPGLVVVYRPLDVEEKAEWIDANGGKTLSAKAKVDLAKRVLIRIEHNGVPLTVVTPASQGDEELRETFSIANPEHFRALPDDVTTAVWAEALTRSTLTESQAKN